MEDVLITLLSTLKYPVLRQGSLAKDEAYPASFFTFWNNDEDGHSFYDNDAVSIDHEFSVYFYSSDPELPYTQLRAARALLKSNGWTITDYGFDVASDTITHIGRGMQVSYLEQF